MMWKVLRSVLVALLIVLSCRTIALAQSFDAQSVAQEADAGSMLGAPATVVQNGRPGREKSSLIRVQYAH